MVVVALREVLVGVRVVVDLAGGVDPLVVPDGDGVGNVSPDSRQMTSDGSLPRASAREATTTA